MPSSRTIEAPRPYSAKRSAASPPWESATVSSLRARSWSISNGPPGANGARGSAVCCWVIGECGLLSAMLVGFVAAGSRGSASIRRRRAVRSVRDGGRDLLPRRRRGAPEAERRDQEPDGDEAWDAGEKEVHGLTWSSARARRAEGCDRARCRGRGVGLWTYERVAASTRSAGIGCDGCHLLAGQVVSWMSASFDASNRASLRPLRGPSRPSYGHHRRGPGGALPREPAHHVPRPGEPARGLAPGARRARPRRGLRARPLVRPAPGELHRPRGLAARHRGPAAHRSALDALHRHALHGARQGRVGPAAARAARPRGAAPVAVLRGGSGAESASPRCER